MTSASRRIEFSIPPDVCPPGWLVTAQSYLVDRFEPDCEVIALPERGVGGGTVSAWIETGRAEAPPSRRRILARRGVREAPDQCVVFDVRDWQPDNWAHFLNNHLPLLFRIAAETGLDRAAVRVVVPAGIPDYIRSAAAAFGIELWATDDAIDGRILRYDLTPRTALRAARAHWVRPPAVAGAVSAIVAGAAPPPARVFLSRRKTRAPSNEAEVEAFLAPRGFEKVYAEDLSVADQFRLFRDAETIVAVHGAGLAPLLYVPRGGRLRHLVEVLPCGHMTDVYRVMAHQVGVGWIGVRGRIKPEYVRPAYAIGTPFKTYSLDSFEIDTKALAKAFELADLAPRHSAAS